MTRWTHTADKQGLLAFLDRSSTGQKLAARLGLAAKPPARVGLTFSTFLDTPVKITSRRGGANKAIGPKDFDLASAHRVAKVAFADYRQRFGCTDPSELPAELSFRRHCGNMTIGCERRRGVRSTRGGEPDNLNALGYRQSSCFLPLQLPSALLPEAPAELGVAAAGRIHSALLITEKATKTTWVLLHVQLFQAVASAQSTPWYQVVDIERAHTRFVFLPPRCVGSRVTIARPRPELVPPWHLKKKKRGAQPVPTAVNLPKAPFPQSHAAVIPLHNI
jgi:hypothetical protein